MKSFYFVFVLFCFHQLGIAVQYSLFEEVGLVEGTMVSVLAVLSFASMYSLFTALNQKLMPKKIQWVGPSLLFFFFILAQSYHLNREEPLGIILLHKYGGELGNSQGLSVFWENATWVTLCFYFFYPFLLLILQIKFKALTPPLSKISLKKIGFLFLINALFWFFPPQVENDVFAFARSIYLFNHHAETNLSAKNAQKLFPYLNENSPTQNPKSETLQNPPHVFLVMLESFSADYVNGRKENGKIVTPFLDSLIQEGLYFPHFYSSSVETSKGEFSALCSVVPSYNSNVFKRFPDNEFECLPEILQKWGYQTSYLKAYHSLKFENTGEFVRKNGFDFATGMSRQYVTEKEEEKYRFGWGIQDNIFYQKLFKILDSLDQINGGAKPHFVKTMSVTNHMWFDKIPDNQKYIYPEADEKRTENYANSVHLTDKYLQEFFKQLHQRETLKNSIVLITGDNGFAMNQHGNYYNQKTVYNELFRTPLLILGANHLKEKFNTELHYSQVDIAPTILDLLGIKVKNHMQGQSLVGAKTHSPIKQIQPFDGVQFGLIHYPWKAIYKMNRDRFHYYNLAEDPGETKKIPSNKVPQEVKDRLKEMRDEIYFNEQLLNENRIFPPDSQEEIFRFYIPERKMENSGSAELKVQTNQMEKIKQLKVINLCRNQNGELSATTLAMDTLKMGSNPLPAELICEGFSQLQIVLGEKNLFETNLFRESNQATLLTDLEWEGTQGWREKRINESVSGIPLKIGSQTFDFGVGTHANSTFKIQLDGKYQTLQGYYGMDSQGKCGDGSLFNVYLDGKQKISEHKVLEDEPSFLNLNVAGVRELHLETLKGKTKQCDHNNWAQMILLK